MSVDKLRSDWLDGPVIAEVTNNVTLQRWLQDAQEDLRNMHEKLVELDVKVNPTP